MSDCWKLIQACGLIILPLIVLSAAAVPAAAASMLWLPFRSWPIAAAVGGDLPL